MLFHSKCSFRDLVFVSEIYREDWSFIGKKSRDTNKWLGVVVSIEFTDWDKIEELYTVHRVHIKGDRFKFVPEQYKYPANFVYKVEDVIYSFDNTEFKFLSERRNNIKWVNPDKALSKYFRENTSRDEMVDLLERYRMWFKTE